MVGGKKKDSPEQGERREGEVVPEAEKGDRSTAAFERFERELAIEEEQFQHIAKKLEQLLTPAETPPESLSIAQALQDETATALGRERDAILRRALAAVNTHGEALRMAEVVLEGLRALSMRSEDDLKKMDGYLVMAINALASARTAAGAWQSLRESAQKIQDAYRAALVHEAGFSDIEDLQSAKWQKKERAYGLQIRWFGRWRFRSEIGDFEREYRRLESIEAAVNARVSFPALPNARRENATETRNTFAAVLVEKVRKQFYTLEHQALGSEMTLPALDDARVDALNDEYIARFVLPYIDKQRANYASGAGGVLASASAEYAATLANPEAIRQFVGLIRESFGYSWSDIWQSFNEKSPGKKLRERIQALGHPLEDIIRDFSYGGVPTLNAHYSQMAHFTSTLLQAEAGNALDRTLSRFQAALDTGSSEPEVAELSARLGSQRERIFKASRAEERSGFLDTLGMNRWEVFRDQILQMQPLDGRRINHVNESLGRMLSRRLMEHVGDRDKNSAVKLGKDLLHFRDPTLVPVNVMNAYRESGFSGERPFLSTSYGQALSDQTELFKYLRGFDASQRAAIEQLGIPGLMEVLRLIEQNPKTFSERVRKNKTTEQWEKHPVHDAIENHLVAMSVHFLERGDATEQVFAINMLSQLDHDISLAYPTLRDLLRTSADRQRIPEAIFDLTRYRAWGGDAMAAALVFECASSLESTLQAQIRKDAPQLLMGFIGKIAIESRTITDAADVLDITPDDLQKTLTFIRALKDAGSRYDSNSAWKFRSYVKCAKDPNVLPLVQGLMRYGYWFTADHAEELLAIAHKKDTVLAHIEEIRGLFPTFRYEFKDGEGRRNAAGKIEATYVSDPYDVLAHSPISVQEVLATLWQKRDESGQWSRAYSDGFLRVMRGSDRVLRNTPAGKEPITPERYDAFHRALQKLAEKTVAVSGENPMQIRFYLNKYCIQFLGRQSERIEEVLAISQRVPELFQLLQEGGPLATNCDNVIRTIFENGNALRRAQEVVAIFTQKVPYWKQLYLYTESRIGEQLAASNSGYPIDVIAGFSLEKLVAAHRQTKAARPSNVSRLELLVQDDGVREQLLRGEITAVPFCALSGTTKRLVFRDFLRRTIETSRSVQAKADAEARNRTAVSQPLELKDGMYLHGSAIDHIESVLLNGNLPQEALGEYAGTDGYPFHVDFTRLEKDFLAANPSVEGALTHSLSAGYGLRGLSGEAGQLFYVYDRRSSGWEPGKEYGPAGGYGRSHALLFGGIPATEVSAIALRNPSGTLERAKRAVLENGFYIPIYDSSGSLLFTPEQFDAASSDLNLSVPVEVWDSSLKTGEQLGSNAGATYTIPGVSGPVRYYVKFAKPEGTEQLWNEQLANILYRELGIRVPETKVVRVEGRYGHASRWIEAQTSVSTPSENVSLKSGFVADALLANWDIPYAVQRNTLEADGVCYRIDNGGALLFHAQGARKSREEFGSVVQELGAGHDMEQLWLGMRQQYPGLTDEDVRAQAEIVRDRLTDDVISRIVDSVRLSKKDRDELKRTLKARRDDIMERLG